MKYAQSEILHVTKMISLELKILYLMRNKMDPLGDTACKANEIDRNENTSCEVKKNGLKGKYFM